MFVALTLDQRELLFGSFIFLNNPPLIWIEIDSSDWWKYLEVLQLHNNRCLTSDVSDVE